MTRVYGEWRTINAIVADCAKKEREAEEKRVPKHPRTDLLEDDLKRAIRIMNDYGYIVVLETELFFSWNEIKGKERKFNFYVAPSKDNASFIGADSYQTQDEAIVASKGPAIEYPEASIYLIEILGEIDFVPTLMRK